MQYYKHSNKRLVPRGRNGRFQKATILNNFGIIANVERLICGKCGHGKKDHFFPVVISGECPKCANTEGHIPLMQHLKDLVGGQFWYVMEFWEEYQAIAVTVASVSDKRVITIEFFAEYDYLGNYKITDPTELYTDKVEAMREAAHRNALAINNKNDEF